MRHYKVNKISNTVFESMDEVPSDLSVVPDWRVSHIGDWVKADDGCVIQVLFVQYISSGLAAQDAYLRAFPTNNPHYANTKSSSLIKTERIVKAMKKELEPIIEELGISPKYVLDRIKSEADDSEKADTRLKALFKLSDILDLEDKSSTKITQVTGALFQGFSEDQIEAVERPKELDA